MEVYPIRNESRLSPYSIDIEENDKSKWEYLGILSTDMENRWNSWLVRVYKNRKTKKEYGTIYRDGCFYPYNFTFSII